MTSPIQSAIAQVGIAKQSAKGSVAASPTFGHGVTGGAVMTVEIQQELSDLTSSKRMSSGVDRTGVMPGINFTGRCHSKSVGEYLYGAMGAVNTTGSATYVHVFTLADDLPYLTAFGKLGSNIYSVADCKIDSLSLKWEGAKPVELDVSGMGTVVGYPGAFNVVNDDTMASYFTGASGTFKLDVDSSTPVTASITAGEIKIGNSIEAIMLSGAISPNDVFPGRQEVEVTFDVVAANLDDWRTLLTGSSGGTSASATTVFGSFEMVFTNGSDSLKIESAKCAFVCDFPEANPSGGPVTLSFAGMVVQTAAGASLVCTLTNTHASY